MGTEAAWVPWALAAVGAGAGYVNQRNVERRQDDILSRQIAQNMSRQQEADRAMAETMRERAASSAETDRQASTATYLDAVRAAQAQATRGLGQVGAVSRAYTDSANDAALGVGDYGARTAELMARLDAPALQREREGLDADRLRIRLGQIGRAADSDDYLARLRLQMVRANPWLAAAGGLATGAAGAMAGRGGAAAGAGSGGLSTFGSEASNWYSDPALWRAG